MFTRAHASTYSKCSCALRDSHVSRDVYAFRDARAALSSPLGGRVHDEETTSEGV
jgi:hypothetical protein